MTNPFEDADAQYLVLVNDEGQHSLWPAGIAVPDGWTTVHGADSRSNCLGLRRGALDGHAARQPGAGRAGVTEVQRPTPADRHLIPTHWNDTARDVPALTLPELFTAQAARTPDAVAVVSGEHVLELRRTRQPGPTGWPGT